MGGKALNLVLIQRPKCIENHLSSTETEIDASIRKYK